MISSQVINLPFEKAVITPKIDLKPLAAKALKLNAKRKFSSAATSYVEHANVQKQAALELFKLIPAISGPNNKLCLDLGAGPLCNTTTLQSMFKQVIAMDLSLTMLQSSDVAAPRICADMDNLPLRANSVDVIYSNFAMQWSANFAKVMQGLYEVLKPGGQAYISTVVEGSLREIKTAFAALDSHSHINHFNSQDYINQSVVKAGFSIKSTKKEVYHDQFISPIQAIRSIKAIGATTQNQKNSRPGLLTKQALHTVCNAYPLVNNKAHVSYHVVLLALEKVALEKT